MISLEAVGSQAHAAPGGCVKIQSPAAAGVVGEKAAAVHAKLADRPVREDGASQRVGGIVVGEGGVLEELHPQKVSGTNGSTASQSPQRPVAVERAVSDGEHHPRFRTSIRVESPSAFATDGSVVPEGAVPERRGRADARPAYGINSTTPHPVRRYVVLESGAVDDHMVDLGYDGSAPEEVLPGSIVDGLGVTPEGAAAHVEERSSDDGDRSALCVRYRVIDEATLLDVENADPIHIDGSSSISSFVNVCRCCREVAHEGAVHHIDSSRGCGLEGSHSDGPSSGVGTVSGVAGKIAASYQNARVDVPDEEGAPASQRLYRGDGEIRHVAGEVAAGDVDRNGRKDGEGTSSEAIVGQVVGEVAVRNHCSAYAPNEHGTSGRIRTRGNVIHKVAVGDDELQRVFEVDGTAPSSAGHVVAEDGVQKIQFVHVRDKNGASLVRITI